jgi:asparagine synthetase B (glutamine-hydrolysing)
MVEVRAIIERTTASLVHRGPDDEGTYVNCSRLDSQRILKR